MPIDDDGLEEERKAGMSRGLDRPPNQYESLKGDQTAKTDGHVPDTEAAPASEPPQSDPTPDGPNLPKSGQLRYGYTVSGPGMTAQPSLVGENEKRTWTESRADKADRAKYELLYETAKALEQDDQVKQEAIRQQRREAGDRPHDITSFFGAAENFGIEHQWIAAKGSERVGTSIQARDTAQPSSPVPSKAPAEINQGPPSPTPPQPVAKQPDAPAKPGSRSEDGQSRDGGAKDNRPPPRRAEDLVEITTDRQRLAKDGVAAKPREGRDTDRRDSKLWENLSESKRELLRRAEEGREGPDREGPSNGRGGRSGGRSR